MTDHELLAELERLDKAATKGPWTGSKYFEPNTSVVDTQNVYGCPPCGVVAKVVRASQDGDYSNERKANAELIELAGTHRSRILHLLRREQRGRELLEEVRSYMFHNNTSAVKIDTHLKESQQ